MKGIALRVCRGQDWNQFLGREGFESERGGEMPEVDVITQFELWPTISPIFSQGRQREEQLPGINGGEPETSYNPRGEEGWGVVVRFPDVDQSGGGARAGAGGGQTENYGALFAFHTEGLLKHNDRGAERVGFWFRVFR
jgi:hypothetical protein